MKPIWTTSLTWLAVAIVAILLAMATPRVLGPLG